MIKALVLSLLLAVFVCPLNAIFEDSIIDPDNLKLDALTGRFMVQNNKGLTSFLVSERSQGNGDLNGDGDRNDDVIHIYDSNTKIIKNLALCGAFDPTFDPRTIALKNNQLAFLVDESGQQVDLNKDGDTRDWVLHFYRHWDGSIDNLGFAVDSPYHINFNHRQLLFQVSEWSQNADLNNDGDTQDDVVHIYDLKTQSTQNLKMASDEIEFEYHNKHWAIFLVSEYRQGGQDLNGDGDSNDDVIHVYDLNQSVLHNLGLDGELLGIAGNKVAASIDESGSGNTDFNNDGDADDDVLQIITLPTQSIENTGLSLVSDADIRNQRILFQVSELGQNQNDLNGDGDFNDAVVHLYDIPSKIVTNLGLASGFKALQLLNDWAVFDVSESDQGLSDFNGDGDFLDDVIHSYDINSGTFQNLGLHSWRDDYSFEDQRMVFPVDENAQNLDLNSDGDMSDHVLFDHDFISGLTTNHGVAMDLTVDPGLSNGVVFFPRDEDGRNDFNNDGDMFDRVAFLLTPYGLINLKVEASHLGNDENILSIVVKESFQNKDLNSDGDSSDEVIHLMDYSIFGP